MNFLWSPDGMTAADLDRHYQDVLLGFYRQPRMMWYYTMLTLKYPSHLMRLTRFLFSYTIAKTRSLLSGRKGLLLKQREQVYLDGKE